MLSGEDHLCRAGHLPGARPGGHLRGAAAAWTEHTAAAGGDFIDFIVPDLSLALHVAVHAGGEVHPRQRGGLGHGGVLPGGGLQGGGHRGGDISLCQVNTASCAIVNYAETVPFLL